MSRNSFQSIPTTLELNGPILSFVTQPVDLIVRDGEVANFVGFVSATIPGEQDPKYSIVNTGTVEYQWYEVGVGKVVQGGVLATNSTLFLSGLSSPKDNNRKFYLEADYKPSAYSTAVYFPDVNNPIVTGDTSAPGIGTTVGRTGNAFNEPLRSNTVTLTVSPVIKIDIEPVEVVTSKSTEATFNVKATVTDGTNSLLSYQWSKNDTDISGATSDTLIISDSTLGTSSIKCRISHPNTNPPNVFSTPVSFTVVEPRNIIKTEEFLEVTTSTTATLRTRNLDEGKIEFAPKDGETQSIFSFYAPEQSVKARITLGGAAGASNGSNLGGEGGEATFDITLDQNTEYIAKIGLAGSGSFLYRKGTLIAAVGGGGSAGTSGRGGAGGGIDVSGQSGFGSGSGDGGKLVSAPPSVLVPISGFIGGQAAKCPPGGYWASKGVSACLDVGTAIRFFNVNGTEVRNTALIKRGYKTGGSGIINGGNSGGTGSGRGGSGVMGGNGASDNFSGGGGGSGYMDGSVTSIRKSLGGNKSTKGYINIDLKPVTTEAAAAPTTSSAPAEQPTIIVVHTYSGRNGYKQETFETVLRPYDKNKSSDGEHYGEGNRKAFNGISFGPGQWSIKAKHRDIEVVATVAGAAGQDAKNGAGTKLGGLGGIGNVSFRLPRDVEFTFQIGETGIEAFPNENAPSGGEKGINLPDGMGQGGGCTIIYKGGQVLAVSGGGGGAGGGARIVSDEFRLGGNPPNAGGNGGGAHKDGRSGSDGEGNNGGKGATKDTVGRNKSSTGDGALYPVDDWQRNGECSLFASGEPDGLCPCTYENALPFGIGSIKSCDKYGEAEI